MNWARGLWRWFTERIRRHPRPLQTCFVEEVPDALDPRALYVVGEGGHFWFAAMVCPCGCGETLHMSLMTEGKPRWLIEQHPDGSASLAPSVWRKMGCRSHFFLRRGRVVWCDSVQQRGR